MTLRNRIFIIIIFVFFYHNAFSMDTLFVRSQADIVKLIKKEQEYSVVKFSKGKFYIPTFIFTEPIHLLGEGVNSILYPAKSDQPILIRSTSNLKVQNLVLDGLGNSSVGIFTNSDLEVISCYVQNFKGDRKRAGSAIRSMGEQSSLVVKNSFIKNIDGYEDGIVGNSIGANRGVYSIGNYIRISNTLFENILGKEDGDAVHFQVKRDRNMRWGNSNAIIENCKFINFGKRAIKIASSNNIVRNCTFRTSRSKPANVAIAIYGDSNYIVNNDFDIAVDVAWISFSGAKSNKIEGNRIKMNTTSLLFHVSKSTSTMVRSNRISLLDRKKSLTGFASNTEKTDFSDLSKSNIIEIIE